MAKFCLVVVKMSTPLPIGARFRFNKGDDHFAASVALAQRFPDVQLLFTGGSGALRDLAGIAVFEASVAEHFSEQRH